MQKMETNTEKTNSISLVVDSSLGREKIEVQILPPQLWGCVEFTSVS